MSVECVITMAKNFSVFHGTEKNKRKLWLPKKSLKIDV